MRRPLLVALLALSTPIVAMWPVTEAHAGLKGKEKKAFTEALEQRFSGIVYARKDLPSYSGTTGWGPFLEPLVEVRPTGVTIDTSEAVKSGFGFAMSVWWGCHVGDALTYDSVEFDSDKIKVLFKGGGASAGRELRIAILGATTLDQVGAQLDELFSTVPVLDEHPDWPEEIKAAIREGRVEQGMNKRQVYYVVGEPGSVTTQEIDGKKVEIWVPRFNDGIRMGFGVTTVQTGFPTSITFTDGVVTSLIGGKPKGGVSLE